MNEFYGEQMENQKLELAKRMKLTTQNLESKLIKAVEINDEDDNDEEDENEYTFEVMSNQRDTGERSETVSVGYVKANETRDESLNQSIDLKNFKDLIG